MTDKEIVLDALKMLTVVPAMVSDPDPSHLAIGQRELARFLGELSLQPLAIYAWARAVFPLQSGVSEYTIGPGGDFDVARPPLGITLWSVIPNRHAADPIELPRRRPDTIQGWQHIPQKTASSSYPTRLYFDATIDGDERNLLAVYPVPSSDDADIVLYLETSVTEMTPSVAYTFPAAYDSMLTNNLAVRLKKFYPAAPLDRQVYDDARQSMLLIKRANWKPGRVLSDAPWRAGGEYNIYADEYEVRE